MSSDFEFDTVMTDSVFTLESTRVHNRSITTDIIDLTGSPIEPSSRIIKVKKKIKMMRYCTGCDCKDIEADHIHPILNVPICGQCMKAYDDSLQSTDVEEVDQTGISSNTETIAPAIKLNDFYIQRPSHSSRCLWCSDADSGVKLFLCDDCSYSFCYECVKRNIGANEYKHLLVSTDHWSCYVCKPNEKVKSKHVTNIEASIYNMESVYNEIKASIQEDTIVINSTIVSICNRMNTNEAKLASFFTAFSNNSICINLQLLDYLHASDLPKLRMLTKTLRELFVYIPVFTSGLFKTFYGYENGCRLHPHQLISLKKMTDIENKVRDFNSLRGGKLIHRYMFMHLSYLTSTSNKFSHFPF